MPAPRTLLPPRVLPLLYFALAHVALLVALAAVARNPHGVAGFFYHPRMLGIVHLVTLGWITASILGALYVVAPIALRLSLPARWPEYLAFVLLAVGVVGMVAHFWIEEYAGMAWSAGTAGSGILVAGIRVLRRLPSSRIDLAVRAHIVLAFVNIAGAATMGVLLAFHKVHAFLPGYTLDNVFAHAHLAAIGWATMMVVGIGYRLLPMVLPAEMPRGRRIWMTACLLETGVAGLFVALLLRGRAAIALFAVIVVAGLATFLSVVATMLVNPRPRPQAIRTPDPAILHAAAALSWLAIACALGLWLAIAPLSSSTPAIATAYGVAGLLGFLAQMIVAMKGRLLPMYAWYWASANAHHAGPVPSPHEMPWRPAQLVVVALWWGGVPALAFGLSAGSIGWIRGGAWTLLIATALDTVQSSYIVRHAFIQPRPNARAER
ncbi:MAG TPA: hypothetical protein VNR64_01960 [Vicinamibacterales bacterium]|nr:hypothetical protein [Vicinamibacterales bacterium]